MLLVGWLVDRGRVRLREMRSHDFRVWVSNKVSRCCVRVCDGVGGVNVVVSTGIYFLLAG